MRLTTSKFAGATNWHSVTAGGLVVANVWTAFPQTGAFWQVFPRTLVCGVVMPNSAQGVLARRQVGSKHGDVVALDYKNLLFLLWSGPQDPKVCRTIYDTAVDLAGPTGSNKVGIVSIVSPGAPKPSREASESLSQLHEDCKRIVHRSAVVFWSDGVIAVTMRTIALGIMQRGDRCRKHRLFLNLSKALLWVTDGLPQIDGEPICVDSVVEALSEYLDA